MLSNVFIIYLIECIFIVMIVFNFFKLSFTNSNIYFKELYINSITALLSALLLFFLFMTFYLYYVFNFELVVIRYHQTYRYVEFLTLFYFPFIYVFLIITAISLLYCLNYNYSDIISYTCYIVIIIFSGFVIFFTDSILLFFLFYELLLIPSFLIIYKYSKTRRAVEASYLMFFWTQFGALFLIIAFIFITYITNSPNFNSLYSAKFTQFEVNWLFFCFLIGFGVKLPIWPFYDWLPKAHVEASTNFSIFLSGVLVKFAFFGYLKCLYSINLESNFIFVYPYLMIGMVDSIFKIFYQIDLKKLIAFATVAEMHWLLLCVISGQTVLWLAGFAMLISHAIISTNSFLLVDSISRRFNTRLINEISGINFTCPKLFIVSLINCLLFLGFPGTLFFISEFLFISYCFDTVPILAIIIVFLLYIVMSMFFFRIWVNVLFGSVNVSLVKVPLDLDKTELIIYTSLVSLLIWLGNTWQTFMF